MTRAIAEAPKTQEAQMGNLYAKITCLTIDVHIAPVSSGIPFNELPEESYNLNYNEYIEIPTKNSCLIPETLNIPISPTTEEEITKEPNITKTSGKKPTERTKNTNAENLEKNPMEKLLTC